MSAQTDYLHHLSDVVRERRADPLEALILARVSGNPEPVEGIVSPPLGREEPDANLLLYHLYQSLAEDEPARDYLRAAVARLLVGQLAQERPDTTVLDLLGPLMGYTQIANRPDQARFLRWALWGLLDDFFPKPLTSLIKLYGEELRHAARVLDLWLAVTPPRCGDLNQSVRAKVVDLWGETLAETTGEPACEDRFDFLLLAFRALLKVHPELAGRRGLREGVRVTVRCGAVLPVLRRRWLGQCWELGMAMTANPDWQDEFTRFLAKADERSAAGDRADSDAEHLLYQRSLREWRLPETARPNVKDLIERRGTREQRVA